MTRLTVLGCTARRGADVVATLSYGESSMITVSGPDGSVRGRLFRTVTGHWDAWTALHPAVPTPSDARLAQALPLPDAIELVLDPARYAGDEGDVTDE